MPDTIPPLGSESSATTEEVPTATESSEDVESSEITDDPRNIPVLQDDGQVVCHLVYLNLFSGSNDIFRTNVGGYFFNTINSSGSVVLSFSSFYRGLNNPIEDDTRPLNKYIESIRSYSSAENINLETTRDDKLLPNYRFVVSVD